MLEPVGYLRRMALAGPVSYSRGLCLAGSVGLLGNYSSQNPSAP
jgi:hypothetical protein